MNVFRRFCDGERKFFFFEINKGCKVSCVKIFFLSTVAQKGTNILFFKHNFEFIM